MERALSMVYLFQIVRAVKEWPMNGERRQCL